MNIIAIEEKAYNEMNDHFNHFVKEIKDLCGDISENKKWLDNQEICQLLNISKRTLQYYRDNNIIPFSRIGNKCFYKLTDIEKLISESINEKKY